MNEIWSYANFQERWSPWERKLSVNKFIIPNVKNIWKKNFSTKSMTTQPTYRNHSKQYCLIKMLEKWKYLLAEISHCCAFYRAIKSIWLTKPFPASYKVGCIWIFSKIHNGVSQGSRPGPPLCNYAEHFTRYAFSRDFHQHQRILGKRLNY